VPSVIDAPITFANCPRDEEIPVDAVRCPVTFKTEPSNVKFSSAFTESEFTLVISLLSEGFV